MNQLSCFAIITMLAGESLMKLAADIFIVLTEQAERLKPASALKLSHHGGLIRR